MTSNNQENRNPENERGSESDQAVSTCYRMYSPEPAPLWLDNMVLEQAKAEAKSKRPGRGFFFFQRPLTFVVALVLCLAIVVQYDDAWILGRPGSASVPGILVESSPRQTRQQSPTAKGLSSRTAPPAIGGTAAIVPTSIPAATHYCGTEQATSPDLWWQCILKLDEDDRTVEAAAERVLLSKAFPDFLPPS